MKSALLSSLLWLSLLALPPALSAAGRQLTGQHAPATTPALPPAEAQKKFTVPDGFEVRLFAAEPDVVNPVAMTWDDRGRLWVVELYEYPLGAPQGAKPRDQIKILEDTNRDGRADKVTVFADGLNLATGILLGDGGAYVGQAPHLLFLKDANGDDVADERRVVMTGFGLEDRHELLNGFTWGPDGFLYMTHGVFTYSKVKNPDDPDDDGVTMTAAVARFHPRAKKFEVFAEGTSNPWGVDFDAAGNAFVSACVIDHLFHMAPGGIYARQAGNPPHPYAYELLPSIVDHKHFRAAYAGVQVYQGHQFPPEYSGAIFMGNIHDSAIHQDKLTPMGASFKASFVQDFVRANDGWFRPVSSQIGPDGALWIMDWYDKYPCYQNANADPEGVDREHGRVWRVVYTGNSPGAPVPPHPDGLNLAKTSSKTLVETLAHPNVWHRRMAQRLLTERQDPASKDPLIELLKSGQTPESRLAALWTLHGAGFLADDALDALISHPQPSLRAWAARLTGERGLDNDSVRARLRSLARDPDPVVRVAVATTLRQFASSSLTVNTPAAPSLANAPIGSIASILALNSAQSQDPLLPFMIWMAIEPMVGRDPAPVLNWFQQNGRNAQPLSAQLIRKTMRRICDSPNLANLDSAVRFVQGLASQDVQLILAALDGLIEGQRGKAIVPSVDASPLIAKLGAHDNPAVASRAQQLGAVWGDAASLRAVLAKISDAALNVEERVKAIQTARQIKGAPAQDALLKLIATEKRERLLSEAIRALGEIGGDTTGDALLALWKQLPPSAQRAASETLASRRRWALPFLAKIEQNSISSSDLPATVIRSLLQSKDDAVKNRAAAVIGKFRETAPDKRQLIAEKRRVVLQGPVNLEAGREIARKTCFNCHKLHGEGGDVGPDLTGVGRSTLDALLANIIDPNQIIGKGYENVEVETKDGRTVSGRLVEDTATRVKLLSAGPREEIVARSDIASLRVSELSVMPEGLEQLPEQEFRDLIWYILNPPQDQRPLTPELRRELIGEERTSSLPSAPDRESVALWNPQWRVIAPDFEQSPRKLPEYAGRKNVLLTHPVDRQQGAALERTIDIPSGAKATLSVGVAADERGDWELRVLADGALIHHRLVDNQGARWKQVDLDLSPFAGKKTLVRLENTANDWSWEFGYWSDLNLKITHP